MASLQNTHIKRLTPADFAILKTFHVKHFPNYKISDQSLMTYLSQSQYQTYGMFHRQHLIGYVIFLSCGCEADIVYIGTAPTYRRKGVASALISNFIESEKIAQIFLEVCIKNTGAINLYKTLGFEIVSIRKKYLHNVDSYIMIKKN